MSYRLLVDLEVVQVVQSLPARLRNSVIDHFEQIRQFPERFSDYHEKDAVGRRVEISVFGGYAIHFWIDHADQHIKVLAMEMAGR